MARIIRGDPGMSWQYNLGVYLMEEEKRKKEEAAMELHKLRLKPENVTEVPGGYRWIRTGEETAVLERIPPCGGDDDRDCHRKRENRKLLCWDCEQRERVIKELMLSRKNNKVVR